MLGDLHQVGEGGVGQRLGGGVGDGAGHVGYAVVDYAVHHEGGVGVGGRAAGLDAAALVDGYVDDYGAVAHLGEHVTGDQVGGLGAGDQHGSDDQIDGRQLLANVVFVGENGAHVGR